MKQMITAMDILEQKSPRMISVSPEETLYRAVELMIENHIGAMLVKDGDDIVGIWTERDHLRNSLGNDYSLATARIGDYMQKSPKTVQADTSIIELQEIFLGLFIRHVLVVKEEKCLGLLSVGDVIRASLLQKDREIRELRQIANWEYYENWGWHRKHGKSKKK